MNNGPEFKTRIKQGWQTWGLLIVLAAVSAFVFLFQLGREAFMDYDEAAYARVIAETVSSGHFLSFRFIGENWFDKPPLYFWTAMGFFRIFGPAEFAFRLPSALSAVLCVVLAYLITLEWSGRRRSAFIAGAMLLTTAGFIDAGRQMRLDTMVLAFILLAVYAFIKGLKNPRWFSASGVAIGLAVMTKSVIGLLVYPILILIAFFTRDWKWLRERRFWLGQAVMAAIALPWHIYMSMAFGTDFWRSYLFTHIVRRFEENLLHDNTSILTYLSYLYAFAMPWILTFVLVGGFLIYVRNKIESEHRRRLMALGITVLFVFALFSSAQTKISYYLLPMFPFMAIFIALSFDEIWRIFSGRRGERILAAVLVALFALAASNSAYRGFRNDNSFNIEHRLAAEERIIGAELRGKENLPVYFADPIYWETIRYYGGENSLGLLGPSSFEAGPLFAVVPTYKINHYGYYMDMAAKSDIEFKGEYFTLLRVDPRAL